LSGRSRARRAATGPSVWQLLRPQRHVASGALRAFIWSWKLPVFGGLALLCAWGCYLAGDFVFAQLARTELLAPLLMRKTVGFVFDFFAWMLLFSTAVAAFATHYLGQDLPRLIQAPVSPTRLFLAKTVEAWSETSWMLLLFALPMLAGAGMRLDAPPLFYLSLFFSLACMSVIYGVAACTITLVIARFFPAKRTQDAMIFALVAAFIYFYIQLQASRPDRFFREDGFKDLVDMLNNLRSVGSGEGVSSWAVTAIFSTLPSQEGVMLIKAEGHFGLSAGLSATLKLCLSALGVTALGALLARRLYLPGYWLSQEGIGAPKKARSGRAHPRLKRGITAAISHRETLIFWRTPSQWTQLFLVGSLVAVYIFNFQYFETLHSSGVFSYKALFYSHLGFSSMALITIAARFLYPSVSSEGKALWVVQSAPMSAAQLLRAKVWWAFWPMWSLSIGLVIIGAWLTELSLGWSLIGAWASSLLTMGIVSLGVGLGAMKPRFDLANPMMIASSLGGVGFMLSSLLYLVGSCLLVYPAILAFEVETEGIYNDHFGWGWTTLSLIGLHLFSFGVSWAALHSGAKGLERALMRG